MTSRDRYVLRPMSADDLDMVREWRNSDRVRPYMYTTHQITEQEHQTWWSGVSDDDTVRYYIAEVDDRPFGVVNIVDIDHVHGTASWGFYIGADDAPRGGGSVMEFLALEMAFGQLGVRKLVCEVLAYNERPLRLHEKFGFQREGLRRAHKFHHDHYEDVVELALFASEWPDAAERLAPIVFRG